ncbi:helix-turn-helix domain-containing protein [Xanthomarina spongicola]|uniref:Helix-turn-helix protein n=1 Tax=Xanthomarina spongicola TaxID=570520 RepID=A0A316E9S9_9FLAO|nr:helix-turn-helix domain-containing protein [Xanthomarina spongicola]PWK19630.1 helix-turn-helix protein [Xanthomarina spongicola]
MEPFKDTTINEWKKLLERFETLLNTLEKRIPQDPDLILLDNADLLQLFKISHKTAQNWRDNKVIAYSQINNKIYYRLSDVNKLLDNNYKPTTTK